MKFWERRLPFHHDVVENRAKDAPHHLGSERCFGRQLDLLSQFQISEEVLSLLNSIEREDCEVHVRFS